MPRRRLCLGFYVCDLEFGICPTLCLFICGIVTTDTEPAGVSRAICSVPRQRAFLMSESCFAAVAAIPVPPPRKVARALCEAHFAAFAACPPLGFVNGRPRHTRLGITRSRELGCGHQSGLLGTQLRNRRPARAAFHGPRCAGESWRSRAESSSSWLLSRSLVRPWNLCPPPSPTSSYATSPPVFRFLCLRFGIWYLSNSLFIYLFRQRLTPGWATASASHTSP